MGFPGRGVGSKVGSRVGLDDTGAATGAAVGPALMPFCEDAVGRAEGESAGIPLVGLLVPGATVGNDEGLAVIVAPDPVGELNVGIEDTGGPGDAVITSDVVGPVVGTLVAALSPAPAPAIALVGVMVGAADNDPPTSP